MRMTGKIVLFHKQTSNIDKIRWTFQQNTFNMLLFIRLEQSLLGRKIKHHGCDYRTHREDILSSYIDWVIYGSLAYLCFINLHIDVAMTYL